MTNQSPHFECKNLDLSFGEKLLFKQFHFDFKGPGLIFIEGENGAGKSTLLKVFAGLVETKGSTSTLSGIPVSQLKKVDYSYFTTTSLGLLNDLTGMEHIELVSKAMGLESKLVQEGLCDFQKIEIFNEILSKQVIDFSQGMKQFLRLFLHLFFRPKILFLDEPFLYLSPKLREFVQSKIEALASDSVIFITDQKITWNPTVKCQLISLGEK